MLDRMRDRGRRATGPSRDGQRDKQAPHPAKGCARPLRRAAAPRAHYIPLPCKTRPPSISDSQTLCKTALDTGSGWSQSAARRVGRRPPKNLVFAVGNINVMAWGSHRLSTAACLAVCFFRIRFLSRWTQARFTTIPSPTFTAILPRRGSSSIAASYARSSLGARHPRPHCLT